jgi:DNA primase
MRWLEMLVQFAHEQLGDREQEALWMRGVSEEQIELYQLGWLDRRLPDAEGSEAFREKYKKTPWWLRDVFVLPLTNTLGQIKGVQFRRVDPDQKGYSDFSPYEDEPVLFGLAQAMPHVWRTHALWVVEGAFDLFPIQRVCPNVTATLTNRITEQTARTFRRFVDDLWVAYDMDSKGREATTRVFKQYGRDFRLHDVRFPRPTTLDGKRRVKDPAELWEVWGDERFRPYLQRRLGPYDTEERDG